MSKKSRRSGIPNRVPKQGMDPAAALAIYREAMRLYRLLDREMPEQEETFWDLTDHIRRTGRWPSMKNVRKWSEFDSRYTKQNLRSLEEAGFLNLAERRTSFPIMRLNKEQDSLFTTLVEICAEKGEASASVDNILEHIIKERQEDQDWRDYIFQEMQQDRERMEFLLQKYRHAQLEPEEQQELDIHLHLEEERENFGSESTIRIPSMKEMIRRLEILQRKKLISLHVIETENGRVHTYQLLPTPELAERLVFEDWDKEPWTEFSTLAEGAT